jgi:hypothetical protein
VQLRKHVDALIVQRAKSHTQMPTAIHCDNNAVISLSEDPLLHDQVKHIDIKYYLLCERAETMLHQKDNVAVISTKALQTPQFT